MRLLIQIIGIDALAALVATMLGASLIHLAIWGTWLAVTIAAWDQLSQRDVSPVGRLAFFSALFAIFYLTLVPVEKKLWERDEIFGEPPWNRYVQMRKVNGSERDVVLEFGVSSTPLRGLRVAVWSNVIREDIPFWLGPSGSDEVKDRGFSGFLHQGRKDDLYVLRLEDEFVAPFQSLYVHLIASSPIKVHGCAFNLSDEDKDKMCGEDVAVLACNGSKMEFVPGPAADMAAKFSPYSAAMMSRCEKAK